MGAYLYPCLIEYSLISVTVFYIMWRNVGQRKKRSYVHFSDRHIYTVNCSRASYGLLAGGLIFLLTVLTLIPDYMLEPVYAVPITHVTELVLLLTSLIVVCATFLFTTKLYYDQQAHENTFDHILILVTTVGDFAYCFFGLFASVFTTSYTLGIPRGMEISISIIAILQTYLQSAFLLDTLKRRLMTKNEFRRKPGRELITALLLINLGKMRESPANRVDPFLFQLSGCMIHCQQRRSNSTLYRPNTMMSAHGPLFKHSHHPCRYSTDFIPASVWLISGKKCIMTAGRRIRIVE